MFIERLSLKNFQCHESLDLEFGPGVNAITGESDRGKSAVIRALRWLFFNKPDGMQYRRKGSKDTWVRIVMDTGITVTRVRSKTVNRYIVERPAQSPEHFDNFGRDVPEPVRSVLNVFPADFGGNVSHELSVARQFDGPFLLNDSPATRAHILGHVSRTSIIDTAVKTLNAEIRARGRQINLHDEEIERLTADLGRFADLDAETIRIRELEEALASLQNEADRVTGQERIAARLGSVLADHRRTEVELQRLPPIPEAFDEIELLARQVDRGTALLTRMRTVETEFAAKTDRLELLDAIGVEALAADAILRAAVDLDNASAFETKAKDWKERFTSAAQGKANVDTDFKAAVKAYVDLLTREGKCPVCFGDADEDVLRRIESELTE